MAKDGKKWQSNSKSDLRGKSGMADRDVAGAALARVWQVYRLINLGVEENDPRRAMLDRFLRKQRDAGLTDVEMLAVEGLKFLKRLDEPEAGSPE
jgi:hypothetical protein